MSRATTFVPRLLAYDGGDMAAIDDRPAETVHALDRVVVVPVNGYVNRLQAWASAAILGAELDVPVQVVWEPEPFAAAPAATLFGERALRSFVSPDDLTAVLGRPHRDLPRYLHLDRERSVVTLAGHDLGEQAFMEGLVAALADPTAPRTLIVIAGGKFSLPGSEAGFDRRRRVFYDSIDWNPAVAERVATLLRDREPYLGLHVRGTDRSREAPTTRAIREAVAGLAADTGIETLFIAADSASSRERWRDIATTLGLRAWTSGDIAFDRAESAAGVDALTDWVLLGRSQAVVHSAESSFGQEAAVATGRPPVALRASDARQRVRSALAVGRSAVTYPSRRRSAAREG